ncbi:MAG: YkgJ family cysteine cluster protein [Dehalococcoidia bacterium]|nr:YkgJ family cysteine cluster protein [Dehalococcoidia bacterium]
MSLREKTEWIKDFRQRFDKEIELLYAIEPFWNICNLCSDGYCCSHKTYLAMQSHGNPFSTEEWFLQLEYVRDSFTPEQQKQLLRNILSPRPACIFLFGNRCSVHPARAWACRVHPYVISYYPASNHLFPVGEIALPSCPAMTTSFDIKQGALVVQQPKPLERYTEGNLIKIKLRKRKPIWVIDATPYIAEYQQRVPRQLKRPLSDCEELLEIARQAGGKDEELLVRYIELSQGLIRLPNGRVMFGAT